MIYQKTKIVFGFHFTKQQDTSVIPHLGSGEGGVYAALPLPSEGREAVPIDPGPSSLYKTEKGKTQV